MWLKCFLDVVVQTQNDVVAVYIDTPRVHLVLALVVLHLLVADETNVRYEAQFVAQFHGDTWLQTDAEKVVIETGVVFVSITYATIEEASTTLPVKMV